VLSLILWALIFIVTFKYVLVLLRADNNGEGGTLTLMALARQATGDNATLVVMLGIIGAALFFGDALITPAISVLSAIEGLKIVAPGFDPLHRAPDRCDPGRPVRGAITSGTASVANFFGPVDDGVVLHHRGAGRALGSRPIPACSWPSIPGTGSRSCSATASSDW